MKILILDDDTIRHRTAKRCYASHDIYHAYTKQEFKHLCLTQSFDLISYDHDIGNGTDGYRLAKWFYDNVPSVMWPSIVRVHSKNPVGAKNIVDYVKGIGSFVQKVDFP